MNSIRVVFVALITALAASSVAASDLCTVPQADRQPVEALQQKLEGEGWQIKKIKLDDGCYEVYAITTNGERIEAYFDPQTFDMVKSESE